jgi:hypothetical protein
MCPSSLPPSSPVTKFHRQRALGFESLTVASHPLRLLFSGPHCPPPSDI